ncbi:hypothetical protein PLICRDRAFT_170825 [Plicaturopsis crispa FD-325 SS-3]|nr:hypothetical protein PLICRDRAFT_170825 [Plicaturopsis crispa FD-325 SS-3]
MRGISFLLPLLCLCHSASTSYAFPAIGRVQAAKPKAQGQAKTLASQVPPIGSGPSTAPDGSMIIEDQVTINGLAMRFKLSGPASAFKAGVSTGAQAIQDGVKVASNVTAAAAGTATAATGPRKTKGTKAAAGGSVAAKAGVISRAAKSKAAAAASTNGTATAGNATAATGNASTSTAASTMGIRVLFHGDGGQSFFDFPNAGVQANPFASSGAAVAAGGTANSTAASVNTNARRAKNAAASGSNATSSGTTASGGAGTAVGTNAAANAGSAGLMGVALLAPDPNLRWGGTGPGVTRPDGAAHSDAVNQLLTKVIPQMMNFDAQQVFMEGVSGGSLLLSGFMMPSFGASLAVQGAVMGCGGLVPQVPVQGDLSQTRIHWQSTVNDLAELQQSIPPAIAAYEKLASDAGLTTDQINALQTADASPDGGHCEFDQQDFVSGVQLLSDNYANILAGNGQLSGFSVDKGVVGNENIYAANGAAAGGAGSAAAATGKAGGKAVQAKKQSVQ